MTSDVVCGWHLCTGVGTNSMHGKSTNLVNETYTVYVKGKTHEFQTKGLLSFLFLFIFIYLRFRAGKLLYCSHNSEDMS